MEILSQSVARLLDYPLGWLLSLPRDITIILIALGTSLLLTFVRKWTTDQNMMRRCRDDLARLQVLRQVAKKSGDDSAQKRMQATEGMIKWTQMKAEFLGLVVSILPLGLLATWAYERLDYLPPKVNQTITLKAYFPQSSVDGLTHVVVPLGIESVDSPIQVVQSESGNGVATWNLRLTDAGEREVLIRHRGQTVRHALRVGDHAYDPPVVAHDNGPILSTEAVLEQPRFLGVVPGIPPIGFAPWLVAYLVLAIILVPCLRRGLKVC
jgi:uncharacterized membrane protein (DUF106 family)